jgi:hypothetical protein
MSTKSSLWWSDSGHLYVDLLDEFEGPHAYLRISAGLVKYLEVSEKAKGLSLTIRLPPEILPILRPDLRRRAIASGRPLTKPERDRAARQIRLFLLGLHSNSNRPVSPRKKIAELKKRAEDLREVRAKGISGAEIQKGSKSP